MVQLKIVSHKYGHKIKQCTVQETVQVIQEMGGPDMVGIFAHDTAIPIEELREEMEVVLVPRIMGG